MPNWIRNAFRDFFLRRELKRLPEYPHKVIGLDSGRQIGVLFQGDDPAVFRQALELEKQLTDMGKRVKLLAYVSHKRAPDYLLGQDRVAWTSQNGFNWQLKPVAESLSSFIEGPYDILIDLTPVNQFYTACIAAFTKASYKVGRFADSRVNVYDLMIKVPDQTPVKELIGHVVHYLKIIQNPVSNA